MDFGQNVTPQIYFDIRLPSRICLIVIAILALSVVLLVALFAHRTNDYIQKISTSSMRQSSFRSDLEY
ncbi:MAG: hypothetical protein COS76_01805 [Candidatus Portnoybacteria bacterium CG06_land_8_20_14_3_00_39_12]|uniref:Uncharacterized protein n=2 Tax=Candidatus Portnoyibacteriota TaxID=1817913 RepID=A0A2M7UHK9_9BACT|nr:MAG: hypothetical protein AUJ33_00015 [Parcubacteria group bacterium CG1_02_40_25]PIU75240.1 MAG: hypothetical protein COS76_01805 [Candidatus Portnoybacteria bacterium CG06_land_8_20_14_3_00_39_12]PIZ70712.1 MAG: hypothetical protein COY09_02385 [Candidatus Portnoybacteria bacterium CG_4_10_14_0_2_um_filter_39_11]